MRKLLLGLFLGLLAVVHSTPVTTVTHIPVNTEDELFQEAMTDGFLVPSLTTETPQTQATIEASQQIESDSNTDDASRDSSVTTEVPKSNATVPASQQPDSEDIEGSAEGVTDNFWYGSYMTTTSMPEASSTTESMASGFNPTKLPAKTGIIEASQRPFYDYMSEGSGLGESEDMTTTFPRLGSSTTSSSNDSPVSSTTSSSNDSPVSSTTSSSNDSPVSSTTSSSNDSPVSSTTSSSNDSPISSTTSISTGSPVSSLSLDSGSGDEDLILPATVDSLGSDFGSGMTDETTTSNTERGRWLGMGEGNPEVPVMVVETPVMAVETPVMAVETPVMAVEKPEMVVEKPDPEQHKGHTTPGWIIIVGFIVGVAALVMLCLAIATRDKWNGPSQASTTKTESNPSNQQRGLEMETFLPRENGQAAEYTVIPLDELSESYS